MSSIQVKYDKRAIGDLVARSPEVRALIASKTELAASALAARLLPGEQVVTQQGGRRRARGYVWRISPRSLQNEARDGALSRALRAVRGGS